jgi:AhpD family alkylhydroperoxidase
VRQPISLAAAATLRWDGRIVVHADAGLKADASREEIAEALGLAGAVNAGARMVYSSRAMDAVQANTQANSPTSI